jgi:hypothetical protein
MTKEEVVQGIFDYLTKELTFFDFKAEIKNQRFVKRTPTAVFIYDIHFYDRTNIKTGAKGFLVEPYIWINVKDIEDVYKEVTVNKELKKETDYITLGNSIANLKANPDGINRNRNQSLDLFIFEEQHISAVSQSLISVFKEIALPYCIKNNDIERVDHLLNQYPTEYSVHMRNDVYRFIKGLIAAKLNRNPAFDSLMSTYSDLIIERDMPDNCKEELERLKAIIPMIGIKTEIN